jgi:tetratricopeptide (TPR) repeat protein
MAQGLYRQADEAYQHALKLDPMNIAAINNYADSLRAQGQHQQALDLLIEGNKLLPNNAVLLHALGLAQVRSQQPALESLRRAAQLEPNNSRYSYIYALGVHGEGDAEQAVDILSRALVNDPKDRDLLIALVTINRDRGELGQARAFARQLVAAYPNDSSAQRLLKNL